jgi:hypothetical protein
VVEATKVPQPRNFLDDLELPGDLEVPVDLGLENVGTTGSKPYVHDNFQVDDLVLVKRANRSDGPYLICGIVRPDVYVTRKLFRFGYMSEVACFDLACPNGRKQLTRYRPGLNGYRELPFMNSAGRETAVRLNCAEHKAQMLCESHKAQGGLAQPRLVGKRRVRSQWWWAKRNG